MNHEWRDRAACARPGISPEIFFHEGQGPWPPAQESLARAVCFQCPVRRDCLDWAIDREQFGMWGGRTVAERRALRAERRERLQLLTELENERFGGALCSPL